MNVLPPPRRWPPDVPDAVGRRLWLLSCGSGLRRRGDIVGSIGELLRRIRLGQIIAHWSDLRAPGV